MKNAILILLFFSGLSFSSCTSLKRYSTAVKPGIDSTLADIDLFGIRISSQLPENHGKSLWDLSADAQSQFIKILNARFPENDKFLKALSFEYMKGGEQEPTDDYVNKDLRLIFSVSKEPGLSLNPPFNRPVLSHADRLEYIKLSLTLKDSSLRFKTWNMYSTEYGSIDVGDVSFNRSLEIKGSSGLTVGKESLGGDASLTGTASLSRKEDQTLKYRYLKLNGRINKQRIEMEEEGTREIDLTGNIIADVALEFDPFAEKLTRFNGLKDSAGYFNRPEKLSVSTYLVSVPKRKTKDEFIMADLRMDFMYRNVKRGGRTFPEWDDRVKYYEGTVAKTIPLFRDRDYVPSFYCIGSLSENEIRNIVGLEKESENQYPLIFSNYDEASAFCAWLMNCLTVNKPNAIKVGGGSVKFKNHDLTFDLIKNDNQFGVLPYYW